MRGKTPCSRGEGFSAFLTKGEIHEKYTSFTDRPCNKKTESPVIRLDCKRAKQADRDMLENAVRSVRSSVSEIMSDGSFRYRGNRP